MTVSRSHPCAACQAGKRQMINWRVLQEHADNDTSEYAKMLTNLAHHRVLKAGNLYCCQQCGEHWYLDVKQAFLSHVASERLPLINAWHNADLTLSEEHRQVLTRIEQCSHFNTKQCNTIPCQVTSKNGHVYPFAQVIIDLDAPIQTHLEYRLANEIADISASPFALQKTVRDACGWSREIRMGFAPTLLKLSNDEQIIANGPLDFIDINHADAMQTQVGTLPESMAQFPKVYHLQHNIISFIATP